KDEAEQQNETADREIDRDLPRRSEAILATPDPDQQECGNEREFVKSVKEKQINRSKCADRPSGNQEKTGVECIFVLIDLAGEPNGGQRYDCREQHHNEAQTVEPSRKTQMPLRRYGKRGDVLKIALSNQECAEQEYRCRESQNGCCQCGFSGREAGNDQNGGDDRAENDEQNH